jgi:hypothetical protein
MEQLTIFDGNYQKYGWKLARRLYPVLGTCEHCQRVPATDRHHQNGDAQDNRRENLAFLCRRCHMKVDGRAEQLAEAARVAALQRTHCANGHSLLDERNVYWRPGREASRRCRACQNEEQVRRNHHRRRCTHRHVTPEAREACERKLNAASSVAA